MSFIWHTDGGSRSHAQDGREVVVSFGSSSTGSQAGADPAFTAFEDVSRQGQQASKDDRDQVRAGS